MKSAILLVTISMAISGANAATDSKNSCDKPVVPNKMSSDMVIKAFNKHMIVYKKCIDQFALDQYKIATESKDPLASQQAFEAGKAAVDEYNHILAELNELQEDAGEISNTQTNITPRQDAPPIPPPYSRR